jgi:hypothetical protein
MGDEAGARRAGVSSSSRSCGVDVKKEGAILGMVLGVVLGLAVLAGLADEGLERWPFPGRSSSSSWRSPR